jgi:hypothetical protein
VSGLFIDSIDSLDEVSGLLIDSIDSLDEVSGLLIDVGWAINTLHLLGSLPPHPLHLDLLGSLPSPPSVLGPQFTQHHKL